MIPAGTGMKRYRNVKLNTDEMLNGAISFDEEISFDEATDEEPVDMEVVSDEAGESTEE